MAKCAESVTSGMYSAPCSDILHNLGLIGNLNLPPCEGFGERLSSLGIGDASNPKRSSRTFDERYFKLKRLFRDLWYAVAVRFLGTAKMKAFSSSPSGEQLPKDSGKRMNSEEHF